MITVKNFVFDFVTNKDSSSEMGTSACSVVVGSEYVVVPFGSNCQLLVVDMVVGNVKVAIICFFPCG